MLYPMHYALWVFSTIEDVPNTHYRLNDFCKKVLARNGLIRIDKHLQDDFRENLESAARTLGFSTTEMKKDRAYTDWMMLKHFQEDVNLIRRSFSSQSPDVFPNIKEIHNVGMSEEMKEAARSSNMVLL